MGKVFGTHYTMPSHVTVWVLAPYCGGDAQNLGAFGPVGEACEVGGVLEVYSFPLARGAIDRIWKDGSGGQISGGISFHGKV